MSIVSWTRSQLGEELKERTRKLTFIASGYSFILAKLLKQLGDFTEAVLYQDIIHKNYMNLTHNLHAYSI